MKSEFTVEEGRDGQTIAPFFVCVGCCLFLLACRLRYFKEI